MRAWLWLLLVTNFALADHGIDESFSLRGSAGVSKSALALDGACRVGRGSGKRSAPIAVTPKVVPSSSSVSDLICESPSNGYRVEYQKGSSETPSRITVYRDGVHQAEYKCIEGSPDCAKEFVEYWSDFMGSIFQAIKEPSRGRPRLSCRPR